MVAFFLFWTQTISDDPAASELASCSSPAEPDRASVTGAIASSHLVQCLYGFTAAMMNIVSCYSVNLTLRCSIAET